MVALMRSSLVDWGSLKMWRDGVMGETMATPIQVDLGVLSVVDVNEMEAVTEASMLERATACCQALVNDLFLVDRMEDEDGVYAQLPEGRIVLPREKPLPKPKQMTKWEKFAKRKNIVNKKTSEKTLKDGEWRHRYGRKSQANDVPWLVEGKMSDDIDRDPYAERRAEKKERVGKNKKQHERNQRRFEELENQIAQTSTSRTVHAVKRKSPLVSGQDEHVKMRKLMQQVMK